MPGTTRYSATFDRTYEEEDRVDPPPPANTRRSRSQSWQANTCLDGRPYTPLGGRPPNQRSSSTDSGPKGTEHIPTRTVAKTVVKAHNNPFQFVKVGTCPLYKKAEEQLKKVKEVKKPDVLKEEEEEWQSNLDSWKSRRRKMSEDVFRRQEEIKQLELEQQIAQASQKKTKTFSEMVESRATRGRALSLCLISSPLEFQNWEYENKTHKNGSCSYTDESEENSTVNSEDEGVSLRGRQGKVSQDDNENNHRTNGEAHIEQNGSKLETQNGDYKKLSELSSDSVQMKPKENSYIDSGLESISSSHRAGDTPDSGSDFSQDSNSSIDCDSPRTGVNILEEFSTKSSQMSEGHEIIVKLTSNKKGQDFGFKFLGGKDEGQVLIESVLEGSKAELSGIQLGDRIITIDGNDVSSKKHIEIASMIQKGQEKGEICLLLWRHTKSVQDTNGFSTEEKHTVKPNKSESQNVKSYEKSIESENEMYVDDFEELRRQSELMTSSNKSEKSCTNVQAQANGNKSPTSKKDGISLKTAAENSPAPKLKDIISNGAVEEPNKNEQKANSELNSENQKKNVVKVKRVRRKGVYALNVSSDTNQIPQEGISANSLFPLSPVTELPSPAEETKTMSSTLSSNNIKAASNTYIGAASKEKPENEEVKLSSSIIKENNKTATSKIVDTVSSNELKSNSSEKIENETKSAPVPSSPTKNKEKSVLLEDSQNEKAKSISTPKKIKVKVKKGNTSENTSVSGIKEGSTILVTDVSKTTSKENTQESKSVLQIDDKQGKISNGVGNVASLKIKENGAISTGTTTVTPDTEIATSKNKIPASVPNDIGNLSPKIISKNEAANSSSFETVNNKQSKASAVISEGDKSKAVIQKKIKTKPKGSATEQILSGPSQVTKETSTAVVSNSSDVATKNVTQVSQPKKDLKSAPQDKQVKLVTENETAILSQTRESGAVSTGIATVMPDMKSTAIKHNIPNTSSDKMRNLALKIDTKNEPTSVSSTSPVTNTKPPRTPQGENSKPVFAQKKENAKFKGSASEQILSGPSQVAKEASIALVSNSSDLSVKNLVQAGQPKKELKSASLTQDKQGKLVTKNQTEIPSETKENGALSSGIATVMPDMKSTTIKDSVPNTPTSTDKTRNLSLRIDTKNESTNVSSTSPVTNTKLPRTPQGENSKPVFSQKKENAKFKGNASEQILSGSQVTKESSTAFVSNSSDLSVKNLVQASQPKKELKSASLIQDKQVKPVTKNETAIPSETRENGALSTEIATVMPDKKSTAIKDSVPNTSTDKTRNLSLKTDMKNESTTISSTSPVTITKPPKSPQGEKSKPVFAQKKENAKFKEKGNLLLATSTVTANIDKNESQKSPSATVSSYNIVNNITSVTSDKKTEPVSVSTDASLMEDDGTKPTKNMQDEKSKPPIPKKSRNKSKKKNTNSQKVIIPAKQNEELKNSNVDSLNIVFQSQPKNIDSENESNNVKNSESSSNKKAASADLVPDVPPVEKVAEEMEKLILEQLEEEERAKELSSGMKNNIGSPEHLLIAPPRLAEPPKEKPPPPPPSTSEGNLKDSALKRVNSTKRIKKEIHKRRSNFLGIDNADENIVCNEPTIPPPPALEEILKAEMELDRQSRLKIESAADERLTLEEKKIMQKEREIIESLESEERQKELLNGIEDIKNIALSNTCDMVSEQDRIEFLKNERKRIETERLLSEEQQQVHLLEEQQLREREEFIRKQEANKKPVPLSDPLLSVTTNVANTSKPMLSSSLPTETQTSVSLSDANGDGKSLTNFSTEISENISSECDAKNKVPQKPSVPPKPLKKKEAIRKERERLRQEQEALQREREEHRRKLMLEQEELMKHQKSHAPDAPVSRLGPLPPLVQPSFPPQLTSTMNATPNARESASFPSRSHHGAPNNAAGSMNAVELMGPPIVRQNRLPVTRKAVQNEAWGQQKMPSVRKQNHDSLTESRYNQNHWLIQEAEMRRITELKERQRNAQFPCSQTHLAEDDVCSNPARVPVIPSTHNPHTNYAAQDKMWNYGQSTVPIKKYPPPVVKEPLHTIYPRETVSQQPPTKPSRVVPMERQEQMLSVSGRKRCSHCNEELGRGAAMIIESLQLYYHIHCFQCCVCQAQLGNGSCGTDVRVRNNKLHCHNCYSNDEAGLKFSQV